MPPSPKTCQAVWIGLCLVTGLVCLVAYSKALGKAHEFAAKHGCDVFSEKAGLLSLVGDERLLPTVVPAVRSDEAAILMLLLLLLPTARRMGARASTAATPDAKA